MKLFKSALVALALIFGFGLVMESAEAARLGGGRNMGAQRNITQRQATPPQQQQQAQANAAQQQPTAAKPNRWLAPLAGLAAGLGLGWLFSQGGMGPMLLILLIVGGAIALMMYMSRQRRASTASPGMHQMQYAGLGNETVAAPPPSQMPAGSWGGAAPAEAAVVPPGFDSAGFLK